MPPQIQKPVIAHVDRMDFLVPIHDTNIEILNEHLEGLMYYMSRHFAGRDFKIRRNRRSKKPIAFVMASEVTKLQFIPHPGLRDVVFGQMQFPAYSELFEMGFKGNFLARIAITNRVKSDYLLHTQDVYLAIRLLEESLKVDIKYMEIAYDTMNQRLGRHFRKYACLVRPPRHNSLFHFKGKKHVKGPSPNGCNEYMGYRPKGYNDMSPSAKRPRGGTRQIFSYDRRVMTEKDTSYSFPRFELRFYRDYLREYLRKYPVASHCELIGHMEHLTETQLTFLNIDIGRLQRERPEFWKESLSRKSTKGAIYMLEEHGMLRSQIREYITQRPFPPVVYCDSPHGYSGPDECIDDLLLYPPDE